YVHGLWTEVSETLSPIAKISKASATQSAIGALTPEHGWKTLQMEQQLLLKYEGPQSELIVLNENNKTILCYQIELRPNFIERWRVRIDAHTGKIIEKLNTTCHIDGPKTGNSVDLNGVSRTINSYQVGSNYYLIDASKNMFNLS